MMRPIKLPASLCFKVSAEQREMVERIAEKRKQNMGETAREILDAGIKSMQKVR